MRAAVYKKYIQHIVFLEDMSEAYSSLTITNDAERVVKEVLAGLGGCSVRILYKDSNKVWGELKHDGEKFTHFGLLTEFELKYFLIHA